MTNQIHNEETFETNIINDLVSQRGYIQGEPQDFDRELCINSKDLFNFLRATQEETLDELAIHHGANLEKRIVEALTKALELEGTLQVLRNGFKMYGKRIRLAYFQAETSFNDKVVKNYEKNILNVTRQVKYTKKNENSLDLVLLINGLPIVTIELKNQFTGQSVDNAKSQFRFDRDAKELMFAFKKRTLIHFVADHEEAWFTTRLNGAKTKFFPFNRGNNNGKGNPSDRGYKTWYLWENILAKDSLMDIVSRFLHIDKDKQGKETLIFPRYHQLEVVRKLSQHAKKNGSGQNYLIQHSAGSGKSNSIAWLSYRLSTLHNSDNERVFDSVIVITDRKVLDSQLQDTIYQFDHKDGMVQKIDDNSQQLAEAIYNGSNIVITTLQKFPFVVEKIKEMEEDSGTRKRRNYSIIVDEAHSSQGGEASKKLKEVLSANSLEEAESQEDKTPQEEFEDLVRKSAESRGRHSNLSFFAFTATPKAKTLEVFGVRENVDDKPKPFHLYSMKQAIEEGFIMDVLKGYTTYDTFYKLSKQLEGDREVNKKKAKKAVAQFASLHPHNIAQKVQVIVEHFRQNVQHRLGGRAKAMIVTSSRLHAVRYKEAIDEYVKDKNYALVAFSGAVKDPNKTDEVTEVGINGFSEKELPNRFNSDDHRMLVVASKYQTGFDQPLLHTMYVDKKLSGVTAVQTLSRLNRYTSGKEDTFVLDFTNTHEDIATAFQPYYEMTTTEGELDPQRLYELESQINSVDVIRQGEVENFAKILFDPNFNPKNQEKLYEYVNPSKDRFLKLPTEKKDDTISQEDYKHLLIAFSRSYSLLSQIMPFSDTELEMLFVYVKKLISVLPRTSLSESFKLKEGEVEMEYYRLEKKAISNIELEENGENTLDVGGEGGIRSQEEIEMARLSDIISKLNEEFGTDFKEEDRYIIKQMVETFSRNDSLKSFAQNPSNDLENFKHPFGDIYNDTWVEKYDDYQKLADIALGDDAKSAFLMGHIMKEVFNGFRQANGGGV